MVAVPSVRVPVVGEPVQFRIVRPDGSLTPPMAALVTRVYPVCPDRYPIVDVVRFKPLADGCLEIKYATMVMHWDGGEGLWGMPHCWRFLPQPQQEPQPPGHPPVAGPFMASEPQVPSPFHGFHGPFNGPAGFPEGF